MQNFEDKLFMLILLEAFAFFSLGPCFNYVDKKRWVGGQPNVHVCPRGVGRWSAQCPRGQKPFK